MLSLWGSQEDLVDGCRHVVIDEYGGCCYFGHENRLEVDVNLFEVC